MCNPGFVETFVSDEDEAHVNESLERIGETKHVKKLTREQTGRNTVSTVMALNQSRINGHIQVKVRHGHTDGQSKAAKRMWVIEKTGRVNPHAAADSRSNKEK